MRIVTRIVCLFLFACFFSISALASTISGTVTADIGAAPLEGIRMSVSRKSDGAKVWGDQYTDSSGYYEFPLSEDRDDLVVWIRSVSPQPYFPEIYQDLACTDGVCDADEILLGTSIDTTTGNKVADMSLTKSASISGTLSRSAPAGLLGNREGRARLYRQGETALLSLAYTDANGYYLLGALDPGNYYLRLSGIPNLIDELYDAANGIVCPGLFCDKSSVHIFTITGTEDITSIDATLDVGTQFSGHVSENGVPLDNIFINFYSETGENVGWGRTSNDGSGNYVTSSGFPAGNYRASNRWVLDGVQQPGNDTYLPTAYPDTPCGSPCDVTAGDILVADGTPTIVPNIDFAFEDAITLSGTVTDHNGQPMQDVAIDVLNSTGNLIDGAVWSDENGFWSKPVLTNSTYYAKTIGEWTPDHQAEIWDDTPCDLCDAVAVGTPIPVTDTDVGGINFQLNLLSPATLSGIIVDAADGTTPISPVWVALFDPVSGEDTLIGTTTNPDGSYLIENIQPGDYKIHFNAVDTASAYIDELYDEIVCNNGCAADSLGTIVTLSGGANTLDEDLVLGTSISGNITGIDTAGAGVQGINLGLFDLDCNFINYGVSDSNGDYLIGVEQPGDFYLFAIANESWINNLYTPYINQQYPGINVHDSCYPPWNDVTLGDVIVVGDGQLVTGIDFELELGGTISGTISDINGVLANDTAVARLYSASDGAPQVNAINKEPDGSYRMGGLMPGTYHVVLSAFGGGLIDERYADEHCPRNSCDPLLGDVFEVVTGQEVFTGVDAVLESGAVIRGQLTNHYTGQPIPDYCVYIYNELGVYATVACSDANGNYESNGGLPDGNYRLSNQLANPAYQPVDGGWSPQVWTSDGSFLGCGVECDFTLGDTFNVSGTNPVENINLAMKNAERIFGTVTYRHNGEPVYSDQGNFWVRLFDSTGTNLWGAPTDPAGQYEFGLPGPGDYYLTTAKSTAIHNIKTNKCWDDIDCPDNDDPIGQGADKITVAPYTTFEANFEMDEQARIFGRITSAETGLGVYGRARLYSTDGTSVASTRSDTDGYYRLGIPPGSYYVLLTVIDGNLIDKLYDGPAGDGIECPRLSCDYSGGFVFTVNEGDEITGVDAALNPGSRISGIVLDGGNPVDDFTIWFYNPTDPFGVYASAADTLPDGTYASITGLPAGSYYVSTQDPTNENRGYYPLVYNNVDCGDPCDRSLGELVVVDGVNDVPGINFNIVPIPPSTVAGRVIDSGTLAGIENIGVHLFTPDCEWTTFGKTDANGDYLIGDIPNGTYHITSASEGDPSLGYIPEQYPDIYGAGCDNDFAGSPEFIFTSGTQFTDINFELELGAVLKGTISSSVSGALDASESEARLYDIAGQYVQTSPFWLSEAGYRLAGIRPGEYRLVLSTRSQGLVDELFDDISCPRGSCGTEIGQPFVFAPGDVITGIDATLDPGSTISGMLTDAESGDPLAGYSISFFDEGGNFVAHGITDDGGAYETTTALPAGDYYARNVRVNDYLAVYEEVEGGYLPMTWPNIVCELPCDALLGDPISVDGTSAVPGIDMALETGTIIFGSVTTGGSTPLEDVSVQLLSSVDGSVLRSVSTDAAGDYAMSGVGSGDYFLRTANILGYEDELHSTISCNPFCDPLSGALLSPDGFSDNVPLVDFDLALTPTISGTVTDDGGTPTPLSGVTVNAYDSLGGLVASAMTNASGQYTVKNLYSGSFFVTTSNSAGFVNALYNGGACLPGCDPTLGDPVAISAGSPATGIDLELGSASAISGTVSDSAVAPISGIKVELYRDTGAFVGSALTNGAGDYSIGGLAAGDYHAVTRNAFGYIDEGSGGSVCQVTCPPASTEKIVVGSNVDLDVDFELDEGGRISGTVSDTSLNPLQSVTVKAFNSLGVQIGSSATGPAGTYTIGGLAGGAVYLRTSNSNGYRDQRYDGLGCDALCDVLSASPLPVTVGVEETNIDFALALGGSIAGTVTGPGPLSGVQVQVFDTADLLAGFAVSAADGTYLVNGLDDGDYRLKTINGAGYVDQVRGGDTCSPEPCAISSGATITVASSSETGVDFNLSLGDSISGVATDVNNVPLPSGTAQVYSSSGQLVKTGGIFGGSFFINGLANGTYYMLVTNELGLVDQLWQGISCPSGSCDVTSGTQIILGGAAASSRTQMMLNGSMQGESSGPGKPQGTPASARLDFEMDRGTILKGSVKDESNNPVQFATVYIFDNDGDIAGEVETDGLGDFVTKSSFPAGTYFVATSAPGKGGVGNGLIDEFFGDVICSGECDPVEQVSTAIDVPGALVEAIDIVLSVGHAISGTVTIGGTSVPLSSAAVTLFNGTGSQAGSTSTNGAGTFSFPGLAPGDYYVTASHPSGDYSAILYNGKDCQGGCAVTTGNVVVMGSSDIPGIDFALPLAPSIDIEKFTNNVNADNPNGNDIPALEVGAAVTWKYVITNNGGEALQNIDVVDDQGVEVDCGEDSDTLAAGADMTCTATGEAANLSSEPSNGVLGKCEGLTGKRLYRNMGTVNAKTAGGTMVTDFDYSHYCNAEVIDRPDMIFSSGFE